jgi:hypothetical protein
MRAGVICRGGGAANAADATRSGATGISNTMIADNGGGDCGDGDTPAATADEFTAADAGHNLDSGDTCFSDAVFGDDSEASPTLDQPADNGGPLAGNAGTETLQTVAELPGSVSIATGAAGAQAGSPNARRVSPGLTPSARRRRSSFSNTERASHSDRPPGPHRKPRTDRAPSRSRP